MNKAESIKPIQIEREWYGEIRTYMLLGGLSVKTFDNMREAWDKDVRQIEAAKD